MPRGVRRFPITNETVDELEENGQIVGVYKLTGTKRLTVTKTLKGA